MVKTLKIQLSLFIVRVAPRGLGVVISICVLDDARANSLGTSFKQLPFVPYCVCVRHHTYINRP